MDQWVALGGSLGGQLAGKGTIDPATTIASTGGQMLMGKATEGLTGAISGLGAKDVSILDDPLKANVAVTNETMSNIPQASTDPFAKSALGQPMMPNTVIGGQPSIMQAAPLGVAAPTLESFSKMDPSKLGFQSAVGGSGLANFMKGIFG